MESPGPVSDQRISSDVHLARDSSCVRRWRNLKFRLIPCGIVNAWHIAIPALPYTRCLTHPDVVSNGVSRTRHPASHLYYSRAVFTLFGRVGKLGNRLAFNETTLILPESRHRRLRFQWTCDSELDILFVRLLKSPLEHKKFSLNTNETHARST